MLFALLIVMLLPMVASDVMFAHCAEGNIICPQGQTSFGWPALSQVAVSRPFCTRPCLQGIVCYTMFLFSGGKEVMLFASLIMMLCLRTVMYCADTQSDVMFAHYAVRRNITYAVNIIAEGNIICPQGQTSFGWPALSQVTVKRKSLF